MRKLAGLCTALAVVFVLVVPLVPAVASHNPNHGTTTTTTTQPPPPIGPLMGGGAWDASNPPVLYVDQTFNAPEVFAILDGTCAYDYVLNANPQGIVGILQGGTKDTRAVIGDGPYGIFDAAQVPSGEIWATWDDMGSTGPLAQSIRSPQPGAWESYLIVFNSALQAQWGLQSVYDVFGDCGNDTKVGNGKRDLQTLSSHELGHAFMDFNDLYSDPNRVDPGNDSYYPNANCYTSGPNTQQGYTMCYNVPQADNNDLAARRLLKAEEIAAVQAKYWDNPGTPGPVDPEGSETFLPVGEACAIGFCIDSLVVTYSEPGAGNSPYQSANGVEWTVNFTPGPFGCDVYSHNAAGNYGIYGNAITNINSQGCVWVAPTWSPFLPGTPPTEFGDWNIWAQYSGACGGSECSGWSTVELSGNGVSSYFHEVVGVDAGTLKTSMRQGDGDPQGWVLIVDATSNPGINYYWIELERQ